MLNAIGMITGGVAAAWIATSILRVNWLVAVVLTAMNVVISCAFMHDEREEKHHET